MSCACICRTTINENGNITLLARVSARNGSGATSPIAREGTLLTQADVSTLVVRQFESDGGEITPSISCVVADCVYDTLQTAAHDPIWANLHKGGNIAIDIAGSRFNDAATTTTLEIVITPPAGTAIVVGPMAITTNSLNSV